MDEFEQRNKRFVELLARDAALKTLTLDWFIRASRHEYSYHFSWLGRPIIQFPQDMVAMQEIIWRTKPDLIVETGIARGGSLVFYASLLELIGEGRVVGVDIDLRAHNRVEIETHPLAKRITLIQGSSIDEATVRQVRRYAKAAEKVLVVLDSDHTHEHVLREMQLYSPLVTEDSYLVVFDTIVEDLPEDFLADRPWGKGNSPRTAVREFLRTNDRFVVDREIVDKLLITTSPEGYLRCVKR